MVILNMNINEGPDCQYLYLLNDALKLRRAVSPLFQHFHGLVKILHILGVHLEEGREFLQDITDTRRGRPAGREWCESDTILMQ